MHTSSVLMGLLLSSILSFLIGKVIAVRSVKRRLLKRGNLLPSITTIRRVKSEEHSAVTVTTELSDGTVTRDFFAKWRIM